MFTGWAGEPLIPVQDSPSKGVRSVSRVSGAQEAGLVRTERSGGPVGCGGRLCQPGALGWPERSECRGGPLRFDELGSVLPGACGPPSGPELCAGHKIDSARAYGTQRWVMRGLFVVLRDHAASVGAR
jgi:hypothetical protein